MVSEFQMLTMHSSSGTLQPFLERLLRRSALSEADQQTVLSLPAEAAKLPAGSHFVPMNTIPRHACLVLDGIAARYGLAADGRRQITALYIRGDMPDLSSVILPPLSSALETLTQCTLLRVPHAALRNICHSPAIAEALWRDTLVDMAISTEWVVNLGQRDAPTRIAHILCELAVRYGLGEHRHEFEFPMALTQHHLAEAAGISTVHANRAVQILKMRRLITMASRCLQVLDWQGLKRAADFDPAYLHLAEPPAPLRS